MVVEILLNGPFSTFNLNGIAQNTESGREWRQGRRMTILVLARISVHPRLDLVNLDLVKYSI